MPDERKFKPPQAVVDAMVTVILYGLGQGLDANGWYLTVDDLRHNGVPFGGWKMAMTRTRTPSESNHG